MDIPLYLLLAKASRDRQERCGRFSADSQDDPINLCSDEPPSAFQLTYAVKPEPASPTYNDLEMMFFDEPKPVVKAEEEAPLDLIGSEDEGQLLQGVVGDVDVDLLGSDDEGAGDGGGAAKRRDRMASGPDSDATAIFDHEAAERRAREQEIDAGPATDTAPAAAAAVAAAPRKAYKRTAMQSKNTKPEVILFWKRTNPENLERVGLRVESEEGVVKRLSIQHSRIPLASVNARCNVVHRMEHIDQHRIDEDTEKARRVLLEAIELHDLLVIKAAEDAQARPSDLQGMLNYHLGWTQSAKVREALGRFERGEATGIEVPKDAKGKAGDAPRPTGKEPALRNKLQLQDVRPAAAAAPPAPVPPAADRLLDDDMEVVGVVEVLEGTERLYYVRRSVKVRGKKFEISDAEKRRSKVETAVVHDKLIIDKLCDEGLLMQEIRNKRLNFDLGVHQDSVVAHLLEGTNPPSKTDLRRARAPRADARTAKRQKTTDGGGGGGAGDVIVVEELRGEEPEGTATRVAIESASRALADADERRSAPPRSFSAEQPQAGAGAGANPGKKTDEFPDLPGEGLSGMELVKYMHASAQNKEQVWAFLIRFLQIIRRIPSEFFPTNEYTYERLLEAIVALRVQLIRKGVRGDNMEDLAELLTPPLAKFRAAAGPTSIESLYKDLLNEVANILELMWVEEGQDGGRSE